VSQNAKNIGAPRQILLVGRDVGRLSPGALVPGSLSRGHEHTPKVDLKGYRPAADRRAGRMSPNWRRSAGGRCALPQEPHFDALDAQLIRDTGNDLSGADVEQVETGGQEDGRGQLTGRCKDPPEGLFVGG
jgi:hypothetical protein